MNEQVIGLLVGALIGWLLGVVVLLLMRLFG